MIKFQNNQVTGSSAPTGKNDITVRLQTPHPRWEKFEKSSFLTFIIDYLRYMKFSHFQIPHTLSRFYGHTGGVSRKMKPKVYAEKLKILLFDILT